MIVIDYVKQNGIDSSRFPYDGDMPDEDFPQTPKIVTAAQMMEILENDA